LKESNREGGSIPVYGSNGIVGYHNRPLTLSETIIIGRKGSIGEIHYSKVPCWPIDTTYYVDHTKMPCDFTWLFYILTSLDLTRLNKSAAIPGLNREDAYEQMIPFPPLPEQQRIAAILQKADRLRRLRRYTRQLSDGYLQSVFLEMFGDPVVNQKGWNFDYLAGFCRPQNGIKAGPFGSSLKKEFYSKSGYRIYGQEQVIGGNFIIGDYYISKKLFEKEFIPYEVKPSDILISLVGTFGKTIIVPDGIEPGIINPRLLKISPSKEILNSVFLSKLLQFPSVQKQLLNLSHGGTMGILNAGQLKEYRIICPPLPAQEEFAKHSGKYEDLNHKQLESERQSENLFQSLLQRAFQGVL
jgi:type I restriction enzyme, S subunit